MATKFSTSRVAPAIQSWPEKGEHIQIRGARVHNLKNIDCDIPLNAITVITGVSGSGKSSLAFDTLYAEGQRRYIESLSAYARQFLERIEKPDVDEISGVAPAIAIQQRNTTRNPRSTVATATETYDYLRLLYARAGRTYCRKCGAEVHRDTMDEISVQVLKQPAGRRFYVLFTLEIFKPEIKPTRKMGKGKRGLNPDSSSVKAALESLQKKGFNRLYQDGRVFEFSTPETLLELDFSQPVYVLVDRLAIEAEIRSRLVDSIETCYREGKGETILEFLPEKSEGKSYRLTFNERFECKACGIAYQVPEPRLFSFNNPAGACPRCQGFGNTIDFDQDLVIPDKAKTLAQGAVEPWTKPRFRQVFAEMKRFAKANNIPLDIAWRELSAKQRDQIYEGENRPVRRPGVGYFPGIGGFFAWLERKKYKLHIRVFLSRYRGYALCPDCKGSRLREEARAVLIKGADGIAKPITDVCKMTVSGALEFFQGLQLSGSEKEIADKILEEVRQRLKFLDEVGLDYLTLDRLTSTLSGGEAQRIQLASALGSLLVGALYVLDEPSIGLHPRDTHRLIEILKSLRDLGNTIVVVEHDPDTILAADYVLDLGPGAGEHGGKIVFAGPVGNLFKPGNGNGAVKPADLKARLLNGGGNGAEKKASATPEADALFHSASLTARYLSGDMKIPVPALRRKPSGRFLRVFGARVHNLNSVDVMIPLGLLVAITGVSGSGKSTLLYDVIFKALEARTSGASLKEICDRLEGGVQVKEVVLVDQTPIGRTPRSNPATYLKAFDAIRDLYSETPEAKRRGYSAGHFSFNIPGGRCEACQGDGTVTVEMQFLADVELTCEECRGTRFKSGVLEVQYRDRNIHEALQLTVREALSFFAAAPKVTHKLKILDEVGLGYLRLGQSATTLSGGEAQRLKLAAHLTRQDNLGVLYILDEPTTGLHFDDIQKLLAAFRKLLEGGASLLVIEHNLDVIKSADWVIDLGPEGGDRGGRIVATGTPEQVARNSNSHTGRFLAKTLSASGSSKGHGRR